MIRACIVSIGNELLNGHTTDTNCSYICGRLLSIGIPVVSVYTVGDDIKQIVRSLKLRSRRRGYRYRYGRPGAYR